MQVWNPWHGCMKISPGCNHCYVYQRDAEFGKDTSKVYQTSKFHLPLQKNRKKEYRLLPQAGPVYTCMTSDFFIKDADAWRKDAWAIIRERRDLHFIIITKRIHRFQVSLPEDWGDGYENVTIACTAENQSRADDRIPKFLECPIRHREIMHEPMLERIKIGPYLASGKIERVVCGGELGEGARVCDFAWILDMMNQCVAHDVTFHFKQTGNLFQKGEKIYHIEQEKQMEQAEKAGVDYDRNSKGW